MGTFSDTIGTFEHYLYKAYDKLGCLIYVGITYDLRVRMKHHQRKSEWHPHAVYIEIVKYPNRATAESDERKIIFAEQPVFNKLWKNYSENRPRFVKSP